MTKKTAAIGSIIIIGIAIGFALKSRNNPPAPHAGAPDAIELSDLKNGAGEEAIKVVPVPPPSGVPLGAALMQPAPLSSSQPSADLTPRSLPIPSTEQMRVEVAANPHGHPPSLMRFAEVLAKKMEDSEKSPEKARVLFDELEECLKNRDTTSMILALCYFNAEELSEDYPEFDARAKRAAENLPKDVKQLLETGELLDE
ncbi:hypothetical protein WDW86_21485 [Bdellovibrionota bacterium FG-2]